MPLYEYKCTQCHQLFEFLEKISAKPKTICPNCQKSTLKRQISLAGFQLKGTGWYETDFKHPRKSTKNPKQPDKEKTIKTNKTSPETKTPQKNPNSATKGDK